MLRELLCFLSYRAVLSLHGLFGFPPTHCVSLVRECSDWGVSTYGIRLRFVNIWIFGTATGWPPCCCFLRLVGGRRQRLLRGLLFLRRYLLFLLAYLRLIAEGTTLLSFISGHVYIFLSLLSVHLERFRRSILSKVRMFVLSALYAKKLFAMSIPLTAILAKVRR